MRMLKFVYEFVCEFKRVALINYVNPAASFNFGKPQNFLIVTFVNCSLTLFHIPITANI